MLKGKQGCFEGPQLLHFPDPLKPAASHCFHLDAGFKSLPLLILHNGTMCKRLQRRWMIQAHGCYAISFWWFLQKSCGMRSIPPHPIINEMHSCPVMSARLCYYSKTTQPVAAAHVKKLMQRYKEQFSGGHGWKSYQRNTDISITQTDASHWIKYERKDNSDPLGNT